MSKVLVTGGVGLVGRAVVERLLASGLRCASSTGSQRRT
jgi:uncharacterized protein YbjT (DUF2867 family)